MQEIKNGIDRTHHQSNYSGVKSKNSPYGTFSDYVTLNPYDSPYDETGALLKKLTWDVNNPLYEAKAGNYDKTSSNTFTNNVNIRWDIYFQKLGGLEDQGLPNHHCRNCKSRIGLIRKIMRISS